MQVDTTDNSSSSADPRPTPELASASFLGQLKTESKPVLRLLGMSAALATVGAIGLSAAFALIVHSAMNDRYPEHWLWLLAVAGIGTRMIANLWRDHLGQSLSAQVRANLRSQLLAQATQSGPHRLERQGNTAWWAHQCLEQVDALHGYLARYLPAKQACAVIPLIIIGITLWVDWIAGVLILLATPIIPISMILIGWGTESVHRAQQDQQASLAAHLMDRLQALPWLRRMGATEQAKLGVEQAAEVYRKISMRVLRVAFLSSAALEFFSALAIGLMAIYIGFALLGLVSFGPAQQMTLASGLFILLLAPECFLPLRQLAQAHHDMNAAKASAEILGPLMNKESAATAKGSEDRAVFGMPASGGQSGFDQPDVAADLMGVTLTWPDATEPVLNRIDLRIQHGEIIGIAGDSGQGKSTLINILAGFIEPTHGKSIRDPHWAWLGQRPHLFHASLRENLLLGSQTPITDDALKVALAKVGLPLPNPLLQAGLDTPIGESRQGVSGGQAQRIALCRAVLSGATLWLLDEPTAALDADTRDALLDIMSQHAKLNHITVVMASHDQAALSHCDRVFVIKNGSLQERK